jgi:hypothetical protein
MHKSNAYCSYICTVMFNKCERLICNKCSLPIIREKKLVMSTKREFGVYIYFVGNKREHKESILSPLIYRVYVSLAILSNFSNRKFSNINFSIYASKLLLMQLTRLLTLNWFSLYKAHRKFHFAGSLYSPD